MDRALDVDRQDPVEELVVDVGDLGGRVDAGVGGEDVDPSPLLEDGGGHRLDRRRVGDVGLDAIASAQLGPSSSASAARGDVDVGQRHPCALGAEHLGDPATDAVGGAGDDCDAFVERFMRPPLRRYRVP